MRTAQGYDEMQYVGLYHLNAYTYANPTWFPDMDPKLRAMFAQVTKGALSGKAGEKAKEEFKTNGQYVNTPAQGVVGIPFFDEYVEKAVLDSLERAARSGTPFFMSINFMKVHQGRRPIAAFGNSDGDLAMLQWTTAGRGTRLALIVHHTDAEREWAYDRKSSIGRLDKALDEAQARGWIVIRMQQDWQRLFPFEATCAGAEPHVEDRHVTRHQEEVVETGQAGASQGGCRSRSRPLPPRRGHRRRVSGAYGRGRNQPK